MKRTDVKKEEKIDFTSFYKSEKEFLADIELATKKIEALKKYRGKVIEKLEELLDAYFEVYVIVEKVYVYGFVNYSIDTLDSKSKNLYNKAVNLYGELSRETAFVNDEILAAPKKDVENLFEDGKLREEYRFMIDDVLRMKPHRLSEAEEKILNEYELLANEAEDNYSALFHGDLKFPTVIDPKTKEEVEITNQNYKKLMESEDREFRKEVFCKYWGTAGKFANTFASILNTKLKFDEKVSKIRGYKSALDKSLFGYNVDRKMIDTLVKVVDENKGFYKTYNKLLEVIYGYGDLAPYDLAYSPVKSDKKYSVDEANEMLIKAVGILGSEYVDKLKSLINDCRIDYHPTDNKKTGAYSISSYGVGSIIFTNFQEKIGDISALAHESGHAVQSLYLRENNPAMYADCQFLITETASLLNELLLGDYVYKNVDDLEVKYESLKNSLDNILANLMMVMGRFNVQEELYKTIVAGDALSADEITKLARNAQADIEYAGMKTVEEVGYAWTRVSHYYSLYYNYQYAIGVTLACIFANKILKGEENAVENYIEFLKDGGRDYSINTLKKYGIDLYSKETYRDVIELIQTKLNEFEVVTSQLKGE